MNVLEKKKVHFRKLTPGMFDVNGSIQQDLIMGSRSTVKVTWMP